MVKLPGSQNVERASPRGAGPIPHVPESLGASGAGDLGKGLFALGAGLQAAERRMEDQRDTIERVRNVDAFNSEFKQKLLSLEGQGIDDPAQIESFGADMNSRLQEMASKFRGTERGRMAFTAEAERMRSQLADRAALASVTANRQIVADIAKGKLAEVSDLARTGDRHISELFKAAEDIVNDVANVLPPEKDIELRKLGRATVVRAKFDKLMSGAKIDNAEALLNDPGVDASLDPDIMRGMRTRIDEARAFARFDTLTPAQVKNELGIDPLPGTVFQRNQKTGEIKVVAAGREETFAPAVDNATGKTVFANKKQLATGNYSPVPQAALVNVFNQPPERTLSSEGEVEAGAKPGVPGMAAPTVPGAAPSAAKSAAEGEKRSVGLFPFQTPKEQVRGKLQIDAYKANIDLLDNISADIKKNPGNYGIVGSVKRFGQKVTGVGSDFGAMLDQATGFRIREAAGTLFGRLASEDLGKELGAEFNPTLPKIELWEHTLALQLAKLRLGQGSEDVRAIEKAYADAKEDTNLTGLMFSTDVARRVDEIRRLFNEELKSLSKTLSGGKAGDENLNEDLDAKVKAILGGD